MKTIVIDPGHGGYDYGAVNGNRYEKNDNLKLGLLLRDKLTSSGQNIIMTRSTDKYLPLTERAAISNQNNADLFISLHRNSNLNTAYNGVENYVYPTAPQRTIDYATNVLNRVVGVGVQQNHGLKKSNFSVLRNTVAPAQLLELGFISNAQDNILFDRNLDAYASAIASAILDSLGVSSVGATKKSLTSDLQRALNNIYRAGLAVDGIFGAKTKAAIRSVRRGNTGELVRILQYALILNGYPLATDGIFGANTEAAVKAFQSSRGLTQDGIAGQQTFEALLR